MKKILLTVFLVLATMISEANAKANLFAYSRPAPETSIYYQDGKEHKLSDYKGEFVIAIFWSRTCLPCLRELKSLNKFYNKTKDDGIKIVMISPQSDWDSNEKQREFLSKYKAPDIDFYVDKGGNLAADFGIFSYPHSVLINQEGEEIGRIRGQMDWDSKKVMQEIYDLRDGKYDVKK